MSRETETRQCYKKIGTDANGRSVKTTSINDRIIVCSAQHLSRFKCYADSLENNFFSSYFETECLQIDPRVGPMYDWPKLGIF